MTPKRSLNPTRYPLSSTTATFPGSVNSASMNGQNVQGMGGGGKRLSIDPYANKGQAEKYNDVSPLEDEPPLSKEPPLSDGQEGPPLSDRQEGPPLSNGQEGPPLSNGQEGPPLSNEQKGPPLSNEQEWSSEISLSPLDSDFGDAGGMNEVSQCGPDALTRTDRSGAGDAGDINEVSQCGPDVQEGRPREGQSGCCIIL